jgi:flagellar biosynthesis protein FliR
MQDVTEILDHLQLYILIILRLSGLVSFAPLFSSSAIAPRIKAGFVIVTAIMLEPAISRLPGTKPDLTVSSVANELWIGLLFGIALQLLVEAVVFAGTLMSIEFSFSLVNILDPSSKIDTPIIGELLTWLIWLVLIGAGLDRSLLLALIKSFSISPVGHTVMHVNSANGLVILAGAIFFAGIQLASPVVAAALVVEICIGMISKISPQFPSMIVGVPIKTLVSYVVLIVSLSVWPNWIEAHFTRLLNSAEKLLTSV